MEGAHVKKIILAVAVAALLASPAEARVRTNRGGLETFKDLIFSDQTVDQVVAAFPARCQGASCDYLIKLAFLTPAECDAMLTHI
jgi:hypothetical protein